MQQISILEGTTLHYEVKSLIVFGKDFLLVPGCICLLSSSRMDQMKDVKAVGCALFEVNCLFTWIFNLKWFQKG